MNKDPAKEQAIQLTKLAKQYFKDLGWSEDNIEAGMAWFDKALIVMAFNGLPVKASKMPEVLRCLANVLEVAFKEKKYERKP
jgi:hypothetical protein